MGEYIAVIALYIFHHSDHGSDHNKQACDVEYIKVFRPRHVWLHRLVSRMSEYSPMEDKCDENEDSEADNLDKEATENNVLASIGT